MKLQSPTVRRLLLHQLACGDLARRAHLRGLPLDLDVWQKTYDEHVAIRDAHLKTLRDAIAADPDALASFTASMRHKRYLRATAGGKQVDEATILPMSESGLDKTRKVAFALGANLDATDLNLNSNDHGAWFLFEHLKLVPTRFTSGGADKDPAKQVPSASYKGVLVYMQNPLVHAYVKRAEEEAVIRRLNEIRNKADSDGVLRVQWSSTSMKGTRWVAKPNCYDAATEILTCRGWVHFADLRDDDKVAQWKDGVIDFVVPDNYIAYRHTGKMCGFRGRFVDLLVTPDHRTLTCNRKGRLRVDAAAAVPAQAQIIQNGTYEGSVHVPLEKIILLCAAQADGWRRKYGLKRTAWAFAFTKQRKIDRLAWALSQCDADWHTAPADWNGTPQTIFYLKGGEAFTWLNEHLDANKTFGTYLLDWALESRCAFLDEVVRWDGTTASGKRNPNRREYCSCNGYNVELVQACQVLSARGVGYVTEALPQTVEDSPQLCESTKLRHRTCYKLGYGHSKGVTSLYGTRRTEDYTGMVYCVEVPTGFIVVRRNSRVAISGNCQNLDKTLKKLFVAREGRSYIGADAAAIEYRIAAFLAGIPELLTLFNQPPFDENDPKEKWKKFDGRYDAHSLIAEEVFQDLFRNGSPDMKSALRTMVKRVVYALFYGAFPEKIYTTILEDHRVPSEFRRIVSLEYIERIHSGFTARFPQWPIWADQQVINVRMTGRQELVPFNRLYSWAMPWTVDETAIRNRPIQLAAGDIVNILFCAMDKEVQERKLDMHFVVHAHDACCWDVADKDVEAGIELVNRHFDTWLERTDERTGKKYKIHIYGQAKAGKCLADV